MKVKILKNNENLGIKQDEIYEAKPYWLDPSEKVVLTKRIPDGYDPMCCQYRSEIEILKS